MVAALDSGIYYILSTMTAAICLDSHSTSVFGATSEIYVPRDAECALYPPRSCRQPFSLYIIYFLSAHNGHHAKIFRRTVTAPILMLFLCLGRLGLAYLFNLVYKRVRVVVDDVPGILEILHVK
ncbi:hypothetical protein VKT23_020007 [Stygiomarasmius scandens]|uniref:Uncharacterized protein n=1 Tax=Marasmiellus scandens TaxID=2682957 RepID=A0ABR1IJZ1_9AGAR